MSDKKWKELLLKSSLPLEHVIATKLSDLNWTVWGQYPYTRSNESGRDTEFSADLHAFKEYSTETHWIATLDVLIECKYASPGVKWIFLPYPGSAELFSGVIKTFQAVSNKQVTNTSRLEKFESNFEYCIRGIALHDNNCDESAITHGTAQLQYAMPRLAERTFSNHIQDRLLDEEITIDFACAILVTTAPLYCLKPNISLDDVLTADSLESIIEPRDTLVLWNSESPDRLNYCEGIYKQIPADSIEERIRQYASVFKPSTGVKYPPREWRARSELLTAGDHVIVTNLKNIERLLKSLNSSVSFTIKNIQKIANVDYDHKNRKTLITGVTSKSSP